ncbi:hypothetical protein VTN77DRAFT_7592 [Rasamsonia byssochlamydoides]|uniref:uncharacterized protein n=1 Tax=Rasamsonia byssochlamydoides TaxID=89139 RepID=UPI003741EC88
MARIKFTGPSRPKDAVPSSHASRSTTRTPAPAQNANSEKINGTQKEQVKGSQEEFDAEKMQFFKQWQSLELVMIMLHVAFGAIFYLREFLPLHCFSDRDSNAIHGKNKVSYKNFIYGDEAAEKRTKRGQPLKVFLRGTHPKADALLDLLEHGIFDALKRNFLAGIQLTVFVDKNAPENVLESHTLSFKYSGGLGDCDNRLASVSLESTGLNCVAHLHTAKKARVGLEMMIRRLILLNTFLPELPNKRFLGVHLFYTEDCPAEYEPPGFSRANDDSMCFPLDQEWKRETISLGTMDGGYHTVGLRVSNLRWNGSGYGEEDDDTPPQIPRDIEYKETIYRAEEIGFPEGIAPYEMTPSECANGQTTGQGHSQQSSQVRHDAVERQRLQEMAEASTQDPELIPTQPLNGQSQILRFELSETRIEEIEEHLARTGGQSNNSDNHPRAVQCQCGWNGEEAEMLECAFCHTRQHMLCYGFLDPNDQNIPNTHACYRCLLEPSEKAVLQEVTSIVLMRRALNIIETEGYPNKVSDFAEKLHCTARTVTQVTNLLKKNKYLQATPGSKSRGFPAKGLPRFIVPQTEEMQQRLKSEVWDPYAKIVHYYTFPVKSYYSKSSKDSDYPESFSQEPICPESALKSAPGHIIQEVCKETPGKDQNLHHHGGFPKPQQQPQQVQTKQNPHPETPRVVIGNVHDSMDWEPTSSDDELANVLPEVRRGRKRGFDSVDDSNPGQSSQGNGNDAPNQNQRAIKRPHKRMKMSKIGSPVDVGAATTTDEESSDSS